MEEDGELHIFPCPHYFAPEDFLQVFFFMEGKQ
jgi:hypothetical protein